MNGTDPVVRCMVLCENIHYGPGNASRVSLEGLIGSIHPQQNRPYPYVAPVLCVFIEVTECIGTARLLLRIFHPDSWTVVYEAVWPGAFGNDRLRVYGLPFRIRNILFPAPGLYEVEFEYNGVVLASQPLQLQ